MPGVQSVIPGVFRRFTIKVDDAELPLNASVNVCSANPFSSFPAGSAQVTRSASWVAARKTLTTPTLLSRSRLDEPNV